MSMWIDIKDQLPPQGEKIKIKTYNKMDEIVEIDATFTIYDIDEYTEAYGWSIGKEHDIIAKPTHWAKI